MKNRNIFSLFTLILVIFGLFAACSDPSSSTSKPDPDSRYTVTFQANGGKPAPIPQSIADGGKVVMPPAMTKTDYGFGGWYKEAACTNQWNFATDTVTGNITLYARWDVTTPVTGTTLADKLAWLKTNAERNSSYLLEITTAYEELPPQNLFYPGRNNITIQLKGIRDGRVIQIFTGDYDYNIPPLFTVSNGVTLILDENLILFGPNGYISLQVDSGGTLIMNQSVKITGGNNGVYVNGGTFTMNGGEISGNTSGGVYVVGGTFTMSGGEISGNTYGGVYVNSGTFTMSGGEISGNTAYSSGGGVYVAGNDNALFTKTGGTIYGYTEGDSKSNVVKNGNVLYNRGHAVYVYVDSSTAKRRETTAGPGVNLNSKVSGTTGGWEN